MRLQLTRRRLGVPRVHEQPPDYAAYGSVLAMARDEVAAWGGTLVFVYLPSWALLSGEPRHAAMKARVLAIASDLGLPTLDLYPALASAGDPATLFPYQSVNQGTHYSERGHRLAGEAILAFLGKLEVLPKD